MLRERECCRGDTHSTSGFAHSLEVEDNLQQSSTIHLIKSLGMAFCCMACNRMSLSTVVERTNRQYKYRQVLETLQNFVGFLTS